MARRETAEKKLSSRGTGNRPLRGVIFVLILALSIPFLAPPAWAQRSKTANRVEERSKPRVEGRSKPRVEGRQQPTRPQPRVVDENQRGEKVRREVETRPRGTGNVWTESDNRPRREPRKALPIIEGERRGHPERVVPERVIREKYRGEPASRRARHEDAREGVKGTLERFRRDLVEGDSRALSGMLSDRSRIKIAIDSKGINDSFSRGQAQYILREYLASTDDRELSFSRFRISTSDDVNAYGVGKLRMRDRNSGRIKDHTVFVSMAKEGETWTIREIRITE